MAEPKTITIHKGQERGVEIGGLRFAACRREIEEIDGGTTLEVWAPVAGADTQVLRFDCFRGSPHYHRPPSAPGEIAIELADGEDVASWVVDRLTREAPSLVAKAGFEDLAGTLDADALAAAGGALSQLLATLPEPSESSTFELEPAAGDD